LEARGNEGNEYAAPHSLLIGHDIGRNDRLAVAWTDRVQNAVNKGERGKRKRAGHWIAGLHALDASSKHALKTLLLIEHPGRQAPDRPQGLKRHSR
jgi:hypothetical protein